ncbi:peptidase associated/transthyretin-like domain-containing protein [Hymenobacter chitinivorans]|uniref:Carboxypeptidase family protein n=1 Tax=Hymenobacter chitinivorans DSM 11115 TaxID=1121954 RepID=A0A2M9BMX6_9BACT|nr:hypothetical protein [Hymenobacter chitinivorans]PJJ59286.1 hypothetical protein CLV45_0702 [Hymenobacter chitinivorans DSM 11115]
MKRPLLCFALATSLLSTASCAKEDVLQTTIVEGRVMNPNTNEPVAGVAVVVHRAVYGTFLSSGNSSKDSVTAAYTDVNGHYRLAFEAKPTGNYEFKLSRLDLLYDLENGFAGRYLAQPGQTNVQDFKATPYKTVTVTATAGKDGKTSLEFNGTMISPLFYSTHIYIDTVRSKQQVVFSSTIKLVPNQEYQFAKVTYNRVKLPNGNIELRDEVMTSVRRKIGYDDTTVVRLH